MITFLNERQVVTQLIRSYLTLYAEIEYVIALEKFEKRVITEPPKIDKDQVSFQIISNVLNIYNELKAKNVRLIILPGSSLAKIVLDTLKEQIREREAILPNRYVLKNQKDLLKAIPTDKESYPASALLFDQLLNIMNNEIGLPVLSNQKWDDIRLNNRGLTRFTPALVNKLPVDLRKLELNFNEIAYLPPELNKFTSLHVLSVKNNKIRFLLEWSPCLTNLVCIYVDNNDIEEIPPSIKNLRNLSWFTISNNRLQTIAPEVGEIEDLTLFNVKKNPLVVLFECLRRTLIKTKNQTLLPLLCEQPKELTEFDDLEKDFAKMSLRPRSMLPAFELSQRGSNRTTENFNESPLFCSQLKSSTRRRIATI